LYERVKQPKPQKRKRPMNYSPYQLVMSGLYQGRKGQRPPVANPTSIICKGLLEASGVGFPQAHLDPSAMAQLAMTGHEVAGFDSVMPEYSVDQEAAALGCQMDWGDNDNMPTTKDAPFADLAPVEIPGDIMEKPSMRVVLDALSILRGKVGGEVAIIGKVMGPWTISYHLAGTQNFLLQVGLMEYDKIRRFMDRLLPLSIEFCKEQFRAGADAVVLADHATGDLVSPQHYKELLLPYHKIITQEVGGPLILHVCGDCSDRLEYFAEAGFHAYHFEWQVGPKRRWRP
jgi:MtaA/CmuA family methyltransferase